MYEDMSYKYIFFSIVPWSRRVIGKFSGKFLLLKRITNYKNLKFGSLV